MADEILYFKIPSATQSKAKILSKIAAIDAIIDSLYNTALKSVSTGNMIEYEIDTGQTRQKVQYSTLESVTGAINSYEKIRKMLELKLQPRSFRLMDKSNFFGR